MAQTKLFTIGHSTRAIDDFAGMLQAHAIGRLIDIRTVPRSRYNPQFNFENLPVSLAKAGISYRHMPGLGGLRRPRKDSPNGAWENLSFRGYADYMLTPEFENNLEELMREGNDGRVAIMCAESVPWRCHRSLVADALLARGVAVEHIMSATQTKPHVLTRFAQVEGTGVTYPPRQLSL